MLQDVEKVELKLAIRFPNQIPERRDTITKRGTRRRRVDFGRKGMRSARWSLNPRPLN